MLALPGHTFKVIAMDGNPVPNPTAVEVLSLAVAERVDAIVEMNAPGVWVLGSTLAEARKMGLGVVVEYAGKTGAPVWTDPAAGEVGLHAVCLRCPGDGGTGRDGDADVSRCRAAEGIEV